jgi:hypothetical protein
MNSPFSTIKACPDLNERKTTENYFEVNLREILDGAKVQIVRSLEYS